MTTATRIIDVPCPSCNGVGRACYVCDRDQYTCECPSETCAPCCDCDGRGTVEREEAVTTAIRIDPDLCRLVLSVLDGEAQPGQLDDYLDDDPRRHDDLAALMELAAQRGDPQRHTRKDMIEALHAPDGIRRSGAQRAAHKLRNTCVVALRGGYLYQS
jgi:hypothetical protein